jgi:hypothetical protein
VSNEAILAYRDLLSLYRGKAAVVEQLSEDTRRAIAIETPLIEFLRTADRGDHPRHVTARRACGQRR